METKITLKLIKSFEPCYSPVKIGFTKDMELTPIEFIKQFKDKVKNKEDILWLLCRKEFMSDKDMRLFAVWCAREALKLVDSPDKRSINACNVAEKYANDKASAEELDTARAAARAAGDVAWAAARAAGDVAWAWAAAGDAARVTQIEKLKEYFT